MVVREAGFMLSNVSLTIAGSGGADEDERGLAAGLLNTSIQLGNAWGLGVVATVVAAAIAAVCAGFAILGLPIILFGLRDEETREEPEPDRLENNP
jgi:hypothetical protein